VAEVADPSGGDVADESMDASRARSISLFAGVVMIIGGAYEAIQSIAAISDDSYLLVPPGYVYGLDLTVWGWVHLLLGLALIPIGAGVLVGRRRARLVGVVVVSISAVANFLWLPYSPVWGLLVISLDLLVISALTSLRDLSAGVG
jgi:hypothetical protein